MPLTPVEQGELARQNDEILVTASKEQVAAAQTIERPHVEQEFANLQQLQAAELQFRAQQTLTGRQPGDEVIEQRYAETGAKLAAHDAARTAIADRATLDVVKAAIPPLDTATAAWRVGVNGEYTWENGITLGGSLLGGVLGAAGKIVKGIGGEAAEEVVGGAANRTAFEVYKDALRADMAHPTVSDARLSSLLNDIYRPNASVGSGSTAAAVRQELATGMPVGGQFHSQKAQDSIRALEKWIQNTPAARTGDRAAAENVIRDMQKALEGI